MAVPRDRVAGWARRLVAAGRRRLSQRGRSAAPTTAYRMAPAAELEHWCLEACFPAGLEAQATAWAERQTLEHLLRVRCGGAVTWQGSAIDAETPPALFYAPGPSPPPVDPAYAEAAALVLAAEGVHALLLGVSRREDGTPPEDVPEIESVEALTRGAARRYTFFLADAWRYEADADAVVPLHPRLRAKIIPPEGVLEPTEPGAPISERRRGSYLAQQDFSTPAELLLHDARRWRPSPIPGDSARPRMLVFVPFLARGGAEHTIFETLAALTDRWQIAFVTLAPHAPELDDRRPDFQALWPRLLCFGDLVHPAAMPGMLASLLEAFQPSVIYNANGTTLFYEFAPELKRLLPSARLIDHLYDHRIGYIESYRAADLRPHIDAVVAENRPIARALTEELGWPGERVPIVWPCGRRRSAFAEPDRATELRRRRRRELGYADSDVVVLTAARMHRQKRPLDLVALADRVRDLESLHFLVVGGGELAQEMDRAIAGSEGNIRRLPFRDDIPELIQACDAGCLVSAYEGLPVFLLECLQAGVPFLGTDVGDLGYVLRASGAGWVVDEPGDLPALEAAVRRLVVDGERRERAAAAAAAGQSFDIDACAERYHAVFLDEPVPDVTF